VNEGCVPAARCGQFAEFQTPEAWRRRQKLHANSLPSLAGLPLIHHPALLLFQCLRVRQDDHLAVIDLMLQHQQPAVRVDHHGLASLFEFLSVVRAALCLHAHLVECPPAASVCWRRCRAHISIIERQSKHRPLALRTGVPHRQRLLPLTRRIPALPFRTPFPTPAHFHPTHSSVRLHYISSLNSARHKHRRYGFGVVLFLAAVRPWHFLLAFCK